MSKIKDTFQYMADLDGLKSSLPRGERPPLRTRHNQATRFSIADESDRIRLVSWRIDENVAPSFLSLLLGTWRPNRHVTRRVPQ